MNCTAFALGSASIAALAAGLSCSMGGKESASSRADVPAVSTVRFDVPPSSKSEPYLADIVQIDSGRSASCALDGLGELACWGRVSEFGEDRRVPFFGESAKVPIRVGGLEDLGTLRLSEFRFGLPPENPLIALDEHGRVVLAGPAAAFTREVNATRYDGQRWRDLNLAEVAPHWAELNPEAITLGRSNSVNSRVFFPAGIRDVGRLVGVYALLCWIDRDDQLVCESDSVDKGDVRRPLEGVFLDRDSSACFATAEAAQCDLGSADSVISTLDGGGRNAIYTQRIELDAPPVEIDSDGDMACILTESGRYTCGFREARREPPDWTRASKEGDFIDIGIRRRLVCAAQRVGPVKCFVPVEDGFVPPPGSNPDLEYEIEGTEGVVEVALGDRHGCGRHRDGHVLCWGDNTDGRLGCGDCGPSERLARRVLAPVGQPRPEQKGPRLEPRPSGGWVNSKLPADQIPPIVWWYDAVKPKP